MEDGLFSLDGTGTYEFIQRLRDFSPEHSIDCFPSTSGNISRLVSEGSADLGITYISGHCRLSPNLKERCFHKGHLALAVPASWDFELGSQEFSQAVSTTTLFYPSERSYWHGAVNSFFAKNNYYPYVVSLENYETALNFVVGGSGMFFAPETHLRKQSLPQIRIIPLCDENTEYRVSAIYATHNQSILLQRILELLPAHAGDEDVEPEN